MSDNIALLSKFKEDYSKLSLTGIDREQFHVFYKMFIENDSELAETTSLFVFSSDQEAESFHSLTQEHKIKTYFYPSVGSDVYSSIIPSETNLFQRFNILNKLSLGKEHFNIVTSMEGLLLKTPDQDFFSNKSLKLATSDIITPNDLAVQLVSLGYQRSLSIEEPGTFSNRGEIFDIYPLGNKPIRIYFFDEMIEEIFLVNPQNLKTIRDKPLNDFTIEKTPYSLLNDTNVSIFKDNIPRPKSDEYELLEYRKNLFKKLNNSQFFEDYPLFISLFSKNPSCLYDFTSKRRIYLFNSFDIYQAYQSLNEELTESFEFFLENSKSQIKPPPSSIYNFDINFENIPAINIDSLNVEVNLDSNIQNTIDLNFKNIDYQQHGVTQHQRIEKVAYNIKEKISKDYKVILFYTKESSLEEIKYIIKTLLGESFLNKVSFKYGSLNKGFEYINEKFLFLSESDFFHSKTIKSKKKTINMDNDLFADQLSTLAVGDYVIHKDHGIGKYLGVQTLSLNGSTSDFVTLEYQDQDKVYVPVYRLNLLQKYSTSQAELTVANLKSKKFELTKTKARSSVKKLAFDLLELQAKRKLKESFEFSEPSHEFNEFALSFPFVETEDQMKAIEDVLDDMQSKTPMDRLVCGDVGFGKTEVAMRASFLAVLDGKQSCILVPTTVLGLQHFNSFKERFKDFPVNIEYLSRFKSAKQTTEVLKELESGAIDILIGTHKLLSDKVKFKDLGLMIIDEEQRFGVAHKEKLKTLKESVDTLTLTATPIPRTLQLSFLGIKELSLIKTPPPRRQSIKTYIIKDDANTMKTAIEKELARGGQVFIVHNKVSDIEIYTSKVRALVPKAKIIFAHGQLTPTQLEKRISDFYSHKYDILISTTIIESGIDIPNANTMIIDRADTYGLSQLHQLRGRIGRSDKKAYAYFIIPTHKKLSDVAAKRLKALQTYAEIGSGFSLASSDLEIRGSGDILGAEQSGHLANIGLELYMELLQEAIQNIKGESSSQFKDIEIMSAFDTYISDQFIPDSAQRIKYYKKLSNKRSLSELDSIIEEITDQFGQLPTETKNLIILLRSRIQLQGIGITKIKIQTQSIILYFDQKFIADNPKLQSTILHLFMQRPKIYKINPDFSINCKFKDKVKLTDFSDFAKYIAEQIHIC